MNFSFADRLRLFNEKVQRLNRSRLVEQLRHGGSGATVKFDRQAGWDSIFRGPDEDALDAALLTLRLFIQDNDVISIRRMRLDYPAQTDLTPDLASEFAAIAEELNLFLDSRSHIAIEEGKSLTYREILELFVYGAHAHLNAKKHSIHRALSGTPFFPLVQTDFVDAVTTVISALFRMSQVNARALHGIVSTEPGAA